MYMYVYIYRSTYMHMYIYASNQYTILPTDALSFQLTRSPCASRWSHCSDGHWSHPPRPSSKPSIRINSAHIRQSKPESGLGFQVKVLETF